MPDANTITTRGMFIRDVVPRISGEGIPDKDASGRSSAQDHDPVNHSRHYTAYSSGVECIEITEHMNFTLGNAIKYIWRADSKNGIEDLEKAAWYINREIKRRSP